MVDQDWWFSRWQGKKRWRRSGEKMVGVGKRGRKMKSYVNVSSWTWWLTIENGYCRERKRMMVDGF